MAIMLFHGSPEPLEKPVFGKGNPHNDYGLAFYCTENQDLAMEWACADGRDGFTNTFMLNDEGLSVCNLSSKEFNILNWLAVLLENRTFTLSTPLSREARQYLLENFLPDISRFDIIRGWRADDSYFSFAKGFLSGSLSLEGLSEAMKLGKLGEQVAVKSEKAFKALEFMAYEPADSWFYYPRRVRRDREARERYLQICSSEKAKDSVYILDIIREGWKNDDKRLR